MINSKAFCLVPLLAALSLSMTANADDEADGIQTKRTGDPLVDSVLTSNRPLTTKQQQTIKNYLTAESKALAPSVPAGATTTDPEQIIDLTNGAKTKTLTLQLGYITSLMVVGENGAPWPIRRARAGDDAVVKAELVPDSGALEFTPQQAWIPTNVILYLTDRNEPIKLYLKISTDPADGIKDSVKVIVDGVPAGSQPLLQPNRVSIDGQLMNALGQSPGRNWTNMQVHEADSLPFTVNYWMSPNREDAIVRLRGASMVGPDWLTETRDPDGTTRVYRYREPVPLMLRVRDSAGVEYQVRLDNPADILAGRDGSKSMTVKATSQVRPPIDTPLPFDKPVGLVNRERVQRIAPASAGAQETVRTYESFEGRGQRVNRVQIVNDLSLNKDTAARLIEESYKRRPVAPAANVVAHPQSQATAGITVSKGSEVFMGKATPAAPAVVTPAPSAASITTARVTPVTSAAPMAQLPPAVTPAAAKVAVTVPAPSSGVSFEVRSGGLYENLFRLTQSTQWKAPIWDLGENDRVIQGGYTITGASAEEVFSKFLSPFADSYRFDVEISPLEKKVWLH
ncbi:MULTISPECIES: DotH/IcmK family type IV secretion protein [Pseudomonas]|uniref:Protein of uncharacterized function (DUF3625) n=2 Tax=Pseudomonas TaxID=286 RepID=A0A2X2CDW4_PSELU|nr:MULTISPECIES: DotH/IcmK family type IV secretion protein [Pseudomonas]SER21508.1 Putative outer membrane core complex of type IVb secretion [Pseudomonas lutea]SPZ04921.1 Protein of uncharacterised function (DUF3625) [Pseudomonas luteola]